MESIRLRVPATTANVGPGFDIFAVSLKNLFDEIKITKSQEKGISMSVSSPNDNYAIPLEVEKNTAGIAAKNLMNLFGIKNGLIINIKKGILPGAGLGTSGASAIGTVYGINKLYSLGLSASKMIEIASQAEVITGGSPHADNAAGSLLGGFVLIMNHNPLNFIRLEVPSVPVVITGIKKSTQTTRPLISKKYRLEDLKKQVTAASQLMIGIIKGDLELIGKAINWDIISEPARATLIPGYYALKSDLLKAKALGVNISGGGSSIFTICREGDHNLIMEIIRKHFSKEGIEPLILFTTWSNEGLTEI